MLYNIGCYIDVCYIAKGRCYIAKVVYTMLYSTSQPSRCSLRVSPCQCCGTAIEADSESVTVATAAVTVTYSG